MRRWPMQRALTRGLGASLLVVLAGGCVGSADGDTPVDPDVAAPVADWDDAEPMDTGPPPDPNLWHEACPKGNREQRLVHVGDVTLNVACRGSGPTVVFLHGFPEFHYSWQKVMDELVDEFRLVAPDQRGYNLSDKPEQIEAYGALHLTQDILALLPLVSPDPVILVAHDWGGPIGWMVAHHPEGHIRAFLATNGPHPLRFTELLDTDPAQQAASSYMDFFRLPGAEEFFTEDVLVEMFSGALSPSELVVYKEAWAQPGAITGGLNWYRANDLTLDSMEEIMAGFSPTVTVPTVVMWGLDDSAVLASNAEGLDLYVEDLEVETFPGVDHWIEHRIPEEIARVIRELHAKTGSDGP